MSALIEVRDLSYAYSQQNVLEYINFTVNTGNFVAIIGPNGSGKSTLLKLIIGLLRPRAGQIRFTRSSGRMQLGYVSQKANQSAGFPATVQEVVSSGLTGKRRRWPWLRRQDRLQVAATLDKVGLSDLTNRNVEKLSGGQKQRVYIARALVSDPQVLILDEPTVGIDLAAQQQFYTLLHHLHQDHGLTIVLVTHDLGRVPEIADRIVCLNRKMVFHGSVDEFTNQEQRILSSLFRAGTEGRET